MSKVRPLREVLAEIPDPRKPGGKRYELDAVLMLICAAMLSGCRNPNQIAAWGAGQDREYLRMLGFRRCQSIRKSALYELMGRLDLAEVEQRLLIWSESVVAELRAEGVDVKGVGGEAEGESKSLAQLEAVALDGKTLRGSKKQGAELSHLLSAVMHDSGITLTQVAVPRKTNEIPLTQVLLKQLSLEGRVFTMDALLAQTAIAAAIVEKGGPTS